MHKIIRIQRISMPLHRHIIAVLCLSVALSSSQAAPRLAAKKINIQNHSSQRLDVFVMQRQCTRRGVCHYQKSKQSFVVKGGQHTTIAAPKTAYMVWLKYQGLRTGGVHVESATPCPGMFQPNKLYQISITSKRIGAVEQLRCHVESQHH